MLGSGFDGAAHAAAVGDIPWPEEPELQELARRAGLLCFFRFPYFPLRYGERGMAFAVRDAGYLVCLRELPFDEAGPQITWLAGLLASRGMPGWLLEMQLGYIERLLTQGGLSVGSLADCSSLLARQREAKVSMQTMTDTGHRFASLLGLTPRRHIRENGMLIGAAVADEASGTAGAQPFISWMADTSRFPVRWTHAVNECYGALVGNLK